MFEGGLTAAKYAGMAKISKSTALRDIDDLVQKGMITKINPGAHRPMYDIKYT